MPASVSLEIFRFGDFELDVAAYELRRAGQGVRLERQPMDLLILLVERRGRLVSRADIIDKLWGKDVFVDVETGVHTAARKIRLALGDSPDAPAFLETVPGKGYRFVAPVEVVSPPVEQPPVRKRALVLVALVGLAALASLGLWRWLGSDGPPTHVMLAVLPFENLTGDAQREYLADGLAEETIASLGQIDPDRLSVLGRTSTMAYKGTQKSLAAIDNELGVDYLVESSLRAEGGRLRITSRLIRLRDEVQVWSASFDREPTSMLGLQRELSTAIAEQIRLRLSPERLAALSRRQTENPEAYDLYLRGLTFASQRTPAATRQAIEYYERTTATDPAYALAWAGISAAYASSAITGDAEPAVVLPLAREAARQAVGADRDLAEAQHAQAYVQWMLEWSWPAAEAGFRRAVILDRGYAQAHRSLGHCLSQMGRHSEALAEMRRTRQLDPLDAMAHALSSQVAFQSRNHADAVEHARQAIVVDPEFWIGYMQSAQALEQLGRNDRALDDLAKAAHLSTNNSKTIALRGYVLAKAGRPREARDALAALDVASRVRYVPPYAIALVHAGLGDRGAVFEWLERAYQTRDVHLMFLPVDPKWDAYRADPRFEALVTRCGFGDASARTAQSTRPLPR
jgi:TolB-like protein/DNA-binding winged helix-turn-helix (wHTH) protein/Flp pilus assembly protein TadD